MDHVHMHAAQHIGFAPHEIPLHRFDPGIPFLSEDFRQVATFVIVRRQVTNNAPQR